MDPPTAPPIFVKRGEVDGENGWKWPLPCFLVDVSSITGNAASNPQWKGLVGLFIGESFFDMVSSLILTDYGTC